MSTSRGHGNTRNVVLALVAGVLVIAGAIAVPLLLGDDAPKADEAADPPVTEVAADLDAVEVYDDLPRTHVDGDVDYEQSPPVGGPHHPAWLDCGVYDEPVREENVVHDLEHGTVWITYRPDSVEFADIEALTEVLPDNGILSPYPDQEAPVVITVWGRQLELAGADDPRIDLFISEFGGGVTAPEPFASCHGGWPEPEGPGGADDEPTATMA